MARDLELDRDELPKYLEYLEKAELVSVLRMKANGDAILRKTFEVGGRKKGKKQIEYAKDGYLVKDNTEYVFDNQVPLWMFGFLY